MAETVAPRPCQGLCPNLGLGWAVCLEVGGLGLKRTSPLEDSCPSDPGRRCAGRGESPLDTSFPRPLRVAGTRCPGNRREGP